MKPCHVKKEPQGPKYAEEVANTNNDKILSTESVNKVVTDTTLDLCDIYETFSCVKHEYELFHGHRVNEEKIIDKKPSVLQILESAKEPEPDLEIIEIKDSNIDVETFWNHYCLICEEGRDVSYKYNKNTCPKCGIIMVIQCLKCHKHYDSPSVMFHHLKSQCEYKEPILKCDKTSKKRVKRVPTNENRQCLNCDKTLKSFRSWKIHERFCRKEPHLSCKLCPYKTNWHKQLKNHMRSHEVTINKINKNHKEIQNDGRSSAVDTTVVAKLDDNDQVILTIHQKNVQIYFNKFCLQCDESFENCKFKNSNYCKKCKTKLLMQCLECKSKYENTSAIKRHLLTQCTLAKWYQCPRCNHKSRYARHLRSHIMRKHISIDPEKLSTCPKCTKLFNIVYDLERHLKYCNSELLRCNDCPFNTNDKNSIRLHVHTAHMTDCKWLKDYENKNKNRLLARFCPECKMPRKIVKPDAPCIKCNAPLIFQCRECGALVPTQESLRIHEEKEHRVCPKCDLVFPNYNYFRFHSSICPR